MSVVAEWNKRLQVCKEKIQLKTKWESQLSQVKQELDLQQRSADERLQRLRKEEGDVERLANSSLSQFFLGLFGRLEERLSEEEKDVASAKLAYDEAKAALDALGKDQTALIARLVEVEFVNEEYARLIQDRESWIREHDAAASDEIERLSAQIGEGKAIAKNYPRLCEPRPAYCLLWGEPKDI